MTDDFSFACHTVTVDLTIGGRRVAKILDCLIEWHGSPKAIVSDNGTEFTGMAMSDRAKRSGVNLRFIPLGKPSQNEFCKSFNAQLRDGCLNDSLFSSLREPREIIQA